jgi:hypothetical protein
MRLITASLFVALLAITAILLVPRIADAHCDTMDGPVARAGVRALESGNLIPVLRWVGAQQEQELQDIFARARWLRGGSDDIRDVVDMCFLMDTAVALVQAYLHVNGYFTVAEYPVLETMKHDNYCTLTDIDLLAYRLPHAGGLVPAKKRGSKQPVQSHVTDPLLATSEDGPDSLIGEVKEGAAFGFLVALEKARRAGTARDAGQAESVTRSSDREATT